MYDLITVGTISIDLFFKGESLTFSDDRFQLAVGGKYFTDFFQEGVGGGAANVAIGTQKLGLRTAIAGVIGLNDFKHLIRETLQKNNVSDYYCRYKKDYYNVSAILLTEKGEKTVINFQNRQNNLFSGPEVFSSLERAKAVFVANSVENKLEILKRLNKNKVSTFLNLGVKDCRKRPKEELKAIIEKSDILFVNGHEFAELIAVPYENINFRENVLNSDLSYFKEKTLIVTEGHGGSFGYAKNKVFYQKALEPKKVVDSTGAGDAYTAGFIAEYVKSKNISRAMEKGAKYASKMLGKIGAN